MSVVVQCVIVQRAMRARTSKTELAESAELAMAAALEEIGLRFEPDPGRSDAGTITTDHGTVPVRVHAMAIAGPGPERAVLEGGDSGLRVVVADQVPESARRAFADHGVGWLD